MASIKCRHGGTEHRHESVYEVKQCVGAVAAAIDVEQTEHGLSRDILNLRPDDEQRKADRGPSAFEGVPGLAKLTRHPDQDAMDAEQAEMDALVQQAEREAEEAAYHAKMERDTYADPRKSAQCTGCGVQTGQNHTIGCPGDIFEKDPEPASEIGIYLLDGTYYKVQESQRGFLYAKKGMRGPRGLDGKAEWWWEYDKGTIKRLKNVHKITAEKASEFGKLWNVCVNCFKALTHEESMDRGYGPTCARNLGWPYDYNRKG